MTSLEFKSTLTIQTSRVFLIFRSCILLLCSPYSCASEHSSSKSLNVIELTKKVKRFSSDSASIDEQKITYVLNEKLKEEITRQWKNNNPAILTVQRTSGLLYYTLEVNEFYSYIQENFPQASILLSIQNTYAAALKGESNQDTYILEPHQNKAFYRFFGTWPSAFLWKLIAQSLPYWKNHSTELNVLNTLCNQEFKQLLNTHNISKNIWLTYSNNILDALLYIAKNLNKNVHPKNVYVARLLFNITSLVKLTDSLTIEKAREIAEIITSFKVKDNVKIDLIRSLVSSYAFQKELLTAHFIDNIFKNLDTQIPDEIIKKLLLHASYCFYIIASSNTTDYATLQKSLECIEQTIQKTKNVPLEPLTQHEEAKELFQKIQAYINISKDILANLSHKDSSHAFNQQWITLANLYLNTQPSIIAELLILWAPQIQSSASEKETQLTLRNSLTSLINSTGIDDSIKLLLKKVYSL